MSISRNHVYGISSKYNFGRWERILYGPFQSDEEAQNWLYREEYDFRERELMSKTAAIRVMGKQEFTDQVNSERNLYRLWAVDESSYYK